MRHNSFFDASKTFALGLYADLGYSLLHDSMARQNQILNAGVGLQMDFLSFGKLQAGGQYLSVDSPVGMIINDNDVSVSPQDFGGIYPSFYLGFEIPFGNIMLSAGASTILLDFNYHWIFSWKVSLAYRFFPGADSYLADAMDNGEYTKAETMMDHGAVLARETLGRYAGTPALDYYFAAHADVRRTFFLENHPDLNEQVKKAVAGGTVVAGMSAEELKASLGDFSAYFRRNPPAIWRTFYVDSHSELPEAARKAVLAGKPILGMTTGETMNTAGRPSQVTYLTSGGTLSITGEFTSYDDIPNSVGQDFVVFLYEPNLALVFVPGDTGNMILGRITTYSARDSKIYLDE